MKRITFIVVLSILFNVLLSAQQNSEHFYYYKGEKIFLHKEQIKYTLNSLPIPIKSKYEP